MTGPGCSVIGSPSPTCTFAAVAAAESRRDKVAFENLGIATLFDSDFCSVPFLEALRSSDTLGRCPDVLDGAFGIAGAEALTGLVVTIAL